MQESPGICRMQNREGIHAAAVSGLASLDIPDSVTEFGEYAFHQCAMVYGGTTMPENPPQHVKNDFSGDGKVTVTVAVLLIRFITEDDSLTQAEIDGILSGKPDINGDGIASLPDVRALLVSLKPDAANTAS